MLNVNYKKIYCVENMIPAKGFCYLPGSLLITLLELLTMLGIIYDKLDWITMYL